MWRVEFVFQDHADLKPLGLLMVEAGHTEDVRSVADGGIAAVAGSEAPRDILHRGNVSVAFDDEKALIASWRGLLDPMRGDFPGPGERGPIEIQDENMGRNKVFLFPPVTVKLVQGNEDAVPRHVLVLQLRCKA